MPLNIIARHVLGVMPFEPGFKKILPRPWLCGLKHVKWPCSHGCRNGHGQGGVWKTRFHDSVIGGGRIWRQAPFFSPATTKSFVEAAEVHIMV